MALWAYIPGKHLEAVGSLPQSARRLDTGHLINDLPGANMLWTRACGYWDLDNLDVALLVRTNKLTSDEFDVLEQEVNDALTERTARRQYVDNARSAWAIIKDVGQDWLDASPPTGAASLALHGQQITYLYNHERSLTQWLGQVGDVVMVLAQVVAELAEQADGIALPD
jgi:hypothetical protein